MTFSAAAQGTERRKLFAFEEKLAVGVVLDHEQVVLVRDLDDLVPPFERQRDACRVLEVRHEIQECRLLLAQGILQRVRPDAVLVGRDRRDLGLEKPKSLERTEVAGVFGEDDPAFIEKELRKQFQCLLGALRDNDVVDGEAGMGQGPSRSFREAA